jgi:hypothetical protein
MAGRFGTVEQELVAITGSYTASVGDDGVVATLTTTATLTLPSAGFDSRSCVDAKHTDRLISMYVFNSPTSTANLTVAAPAGMTLIGPSVLAPGMCAAYYPDRKRKWLGVGGGVPFTGQYNSALYNVGNSGTSKAIDFNGGNVQLVTLTGNVTFTFSNPVSGARYVLILKQDGTGSRLVTWPAAVLWSGGSAPTLTTTASKVDIITLVYDGVNGKYYGGGVLNF